MFVGGGVFEAGYRDDSTHTGIPEVTFAVCSRKTPETTISRVLFATRHQWGATATIVRKRYVSFRCETRPPRSGVSDERHACTCLIV